MKLIWTEKSFPKNEKNSSYQLDSSRTTDSISNIYDKDKYYEKEEKEISSFSNVKIKDIEENEETFNLLRNVLLQDNQASMNIISFKKHLSLIMCIVYLLLFLICIPKIPVKIGAEEKIDILIKNVSNEHINILIKNINFLCSANITENFNSSSQKIERRNNCETTGYLIEFTINKMFIFRWLIGFSYFIIKCICFIYLNNKKTDKEKKFCEKIIIWIQKICMLIFPFSLFYFDLQNKITFSQISTKYFNNKTINFYLMKEKQLAMIDYVEGLIPALFTFLISLDYNQIGNIIYNIAIKKKRINKLM